MIARVSLVLGIVLLLSFATLNVWVPPKAVEVKRSGVAQPSVPATPTRKAPTKDWVVEIPCVGTVTFPASVSEADVSAACKTLADRAEEARKKSGMAPCKMP